MLDFYLWWKNTQKAETDDISMWLIKNSVSMINID